jgi:hypothetical protein
VDNLDVAQDRPVFTSFRRDKPVTAKPIFTLLRRGKQTGFGAVMLRKRKR